jgi:hypothetical protein
LELAALDIFEGLDAVTAIQSVGMKFPEREGITVYESHVSTFPPHILDDWKQTDQSEVFVPVRVQATSSGGLRFYSSRKNLSLLEWTDDSGRSIPIVDVVRHIAWWTDFTEMNQVIYGGSPLKVSIDGGGPIARVLHDELDFWRINGEYGLAMPDAGSILRLDTGMRIHAEGVVYEVSAIDRDGVQLTKLGVVGDFPAWVLNSAASGD